MAAGPTAMSIVEIRNYMLSNDSKVTNHALVKQFKHFLTNTETQNEARKLFKVYVNILATIKNENNQKYLILHEKYQKELPSDEVVRKAMVAAGAVEIGIIKEYCNAVSLKGDSASPNGQPLEPQPPPYVPPPEVCCSPSEKLQSGSYIRSPTADVDTFETSKSSVMAIRNYEEMSAEEKKNTEEQADDEKRVKTFSTEETQGRNEHIPRFSFSSADSSTSINSMTSKEAADSDADPHGINVSVKEATRKFNRLASEEEAKVVASPSEKKKPEGKEEDKPAPEVTLTHKKAKEWIVAMAKASYQDLSKLANEFPELVKLHDPYTGYTALHWAAKHGNQDVIKLIAGTYKADVNARTNGGYTPLHISMQFGRADVFELLCNVYKANRDLTDWSGNKPLDYSKQRTSVSPSTFSSKYYSDNYEHDVEPSNSKWARCSLLRGAGGGGMRSKKSSASKLYMTLAPKRGAAIARTQSLMATTAPILRRRPKKQAAMSVFYPVQNILEPNSTGTPQPSTPTLTAQLSISDESLSATDTPSRAIDDAVFSASDESSQNDNSGGGDSGGGATSKPISKRGKATLKNNAPMRKESFLRKTLRAAIAGSRATNELTDE